MSPSSPSSTELLTTLTSDVLPSISRYGTGLKSGVTGLAFYTAIILPFLHVPLLITGIDSTSTALAFSGLLTLNIVAAIAGQSHHSD